MTLSVSDKFRTTRILRRALSRFLEIDGALFAAAFAHYAFLSLFPLIILGATIGSFFVDQDRAVAGIVQYVGTFIPIGAERRADIFDTVAGVMASRREAGIIASVVLLWTSTRFLSTLVRGTNRALGHDSYRWWRLPLRSFTLLLLLAGIASIGMLAPVVLRLAQRMVVPESVVGVPIYAAFVNLARFSTTFISLALFFKFAPRIGARLIHIWPAVLTTAFLLQLSESIFAFYLQNLSSLNAIYGSLGAIIALLLWIYISGCVFFLGACLCFAQTEKISNVESAALS